MIAKMAAGTEMGRLLVWRAGWLKNQGLRNTRETSLAKWHATEHAVQAALDAIQIHGANGYSNEFPVERYLRNSKAAVIYEGTSQLHTLIQADYALGYREDRPLRCEPLAGPGLGAPGALTAGWHGGCRRSGHPELRHRDDSSHVRPRRCVRIRRPATRLDRPADRAGTAAGRTASSPRSPSSPRPSSAAAPVAGPASPRRRSTRPPTRPRSASSGSCCGSSSRALVNLLLARPADRLPRPVAGRRASATCSAGRTRGSPCAGRRSRRSQAADVPRLRRSGRARRPNPLHAAIGYRAGAAARDARADADPAARPLAPTATAASTLEADVVVVGSGAGGGVVAAELAAGRSIRGRPRGGPVRRRDDDADRRAGRLRPAVPQPRPADDLGRLDHDARRDRRRRRHARELDDLHRRRPTTSGPSGRATTGSTASTARSSTTTWRRSRRELGVGAVDGHPAEGPGDPARRGGPRLGGGARPAATPSAAATAAAVRSAARAGRSSPGSASTSPRRTPAGARIVERARVTRVLIEGGRAVGVEANVRGRSAR